MMADTQKIGHLRPMADADLVQVLTWRNAPEVRKNMYTQHEITLESHLNWWEGVKNNPRCKYLIFEMDNTPSGLVNFTDIDPTHGTSFWGFYARIDAPKGTGSRMEFLALEYAFGALGLNKLCCEVLGFNGAVLSLHQKFGFSEEGVFRAQKKLNTAYENVHRLAMFAENWTERRPEMLTKIMQRL